MVELGPVALAVPGDGAGGGGFAYHYDFHGTFLLLVDDDSAVDNVQWKVHRHALPNHIRFVAVHVLRLAIESAHDYWAVYKEVVEVDVGDVVAEVWVMIVLDCLYICSD